MRLSVFVSSLFRSILGALAGLSLVCVGPWESARADQEPHKIISVLNSQFRSSDYDIRARTLLETVIPQFINATAEGRSALTAFGKLSPEQVLSGLQGCSDCKPNRAVAENLLRILFLMRVCGNLSCLRTSIDRTVSAELRRFNKSQPQLLAAFPEPSPETRFAGEFDNRKHELSEKIDKSPLDNDFYAFKMSAGYFSEGEHETHTVTARIFSRGHKKRNYLVAFGQEQVLDLLEGLRFSDSDIRLLRNHTDLRSQPEEFFEHLRNFKFSGSVRNVPQGTIVFPNEPIMEITGNPIEIAIIETLVLPWVNRMTNFASKAARVVQESGGRILIEGGTRRGFLGFWSAYVATLMGFHVTSNAEVARLTGATTGGTEAHSWVGYWGNEVIAHSLYRRTFPKTTLLVDTYDIIEGINRAVRASGGRFQGFRLDSVLPQFAHLGADEAKRRTTQAVNNHMRELGYARRKYTVTYSDGLNDQSMQYMTRHKVRFQIALIGTDLAAPDTPHLNMVYKTVQKKNNKTEKVTYPIKLSVGKVLQPGTSQIIRKYDSDGKIESDVLATADECMDGCKEGTPLLVETFRDGKRIREAEDINTTKKYIQQQLRSLPDFLKQLEPLPPERAFKFEQSEEAKRVQKEAIERAKPENLRKIGYAVVLSHTLNQRHRTALKRVQTLMGFDEIHLVLYEEKNQEGPDSSREEVSNSVVKARRLFPPDKIAEHGVNVWEDPRPSQNGFAAKIRRLRRQVLGGASKDSVQETVIVDHELFVRLAQEGGEKGLARGLNWTVLLRKGAPQSLEEMGVMEVLNAGDYRLLNQDSVAIRDWGDAHESRIELVDLDLPANAARQEKVKSCRAAGR